MASHQNLDIGGLVAEVLACVGRHGHSVLIFFSFPVAISRHDPIAFLKKASLSTCCQLISERFG